MHVRQGILLTEGVDAEGVGPDAEQVPEHIKKKLETGDYGDVFEWFDSPAGKKVADNIIKKNIFKHSITFKNDGQLYTLFLKDSLEDPLPDDPESSDSGPKKKKPKHHKIETREAKFVHGSIALKISIDDAEGVIKEALKDKKVRRVCSGPPTDQFDP